MVSDVGKGIPKGYDPGLIDPCDEHILPPFDHALGDGYDLLRGLPLSHDDFREALSDMTMVVDHGFPDVLKRQSLDRFDSLIHCPFSHLNVFQKFPEPVNVHNGRFT
jgi:hypothetical protein